MEEAGLAPGGEHTYGLEVVVISVWLGYLGPLVLRAGSQLESCSAQDQHRPNEVEIQG